MSIVFRFDNVLVLKINTKLIIYPNPAIILENIFIYIVINKPFIY